MHVKSLNFEFLRSDWPELASLAGFAEQYAFADPASLVKLRSFAEQVVEIVYEKFNLQPPPQARLMELLCEDSFRQSEAGKEDVSDHVLPAYRHGMDRKK